ncbi:hypothetical protein [Algoriphagus antarcticus]|uniref:Uncharacterized protein n=1 Tax=Algoriphagus antarcticus TaxID=238540 RepID=A0A3E0D611_9BACT|nr:hypothetical protein [Algoriphagus antarcticus]REG77545.1 hypothetical protein C8N25_14217 [Algoriphagus antarcticus]
MKRSFLAFSLIFWAIPFTFSQSTENFPPPEKSPEVFAKRAFEKITIDGKLDEADWDSAKLRPGRKFLHIYRKGTKVEIGRFCFL